MKTKILVTGAAGFIGFHLTRKLVNEGFEVVGIDALANGRSYELAVQRFKMLEEMPDLRLVNISISDAEELNKFFHAEKFDYVLHLAAQPGVRESFVNPGPCIQANVVCFGNMLEACRLTGVKHLVYASSSSVYGLSTALPWSSHASIGHPASLYAATKRANELMAHSYSHAYNLPTTGLRFFTVYGPWGRPDMAPMIFADAIRKGEPIKLFNFGNCSRDFTYVDDIVNGLRQVVMSPPVPNPDWDTHDADSATSSAPYAVYNIGKGHPESLLEFVDELEAALGKKAERILLPLQAGDVADTHAEVDPIFLSGPYKPVISLKEGVGRFAAWYKERYWN